jgi:hypothetical protein
MRNLLLVVTVALLALSGCGKSENNHAIVFLTTGALTARLSGPSCSLAANTRAGQIEEALKSGVSANAEIDALIGGADETPLNLLTAELSITNDLDQLALARKFGVRTSRIQSDVLASSIAKACNT